VNAVPDDQPGPKVVRRLEEVTGMLSDLAEVLAAEEELGRVLQRSVDQLTGAVPAADMASVSVLRGDTAETVAASSKDVWEIDQDQYAAGDGPCLEAARSGQVVRTGMDEALSRWPEFARSSRAAGVESYLSCPLFLDEDFVGSLNLYSGQRHGFADFDVALLELYATAACAAIANARSGAGLARGDRSGHRHRDGQARRHRRAGVRRVVPAVAAHQREAAGGRLPGSRRAGRRRKSSVRRPSRVCLTGGYSS
jgi:GAF domain-containing protein